MATPPTPERRRATLTELGFGLGRVEEILTEFRNDVGGWQAGISQTLHDHGTRIRALEEDRKIRMAAEHAANEARRQARAEALENEDRWGRWSPRAVAVTIGSGGGGLIILSTLKVFGVL